MARCVVPGCCKRSYQKSKDQENLEKHCKITFHRFPKDETKRFTWIKAIGLDPEKLPKHPYLCSLHFRESDIDRTSLMVIRLRENAIPIVNTSQTNIKAKAIENLEHLGQTPISTELIVNTSQNNIKTEELENFEHSLPTSAELTTSISQSNNNSKEIDNFEHISREPLQISIQTPVSTELTSGIGIENKETQRTHREEDNNENEIALMRKRYTCTLDHSYQPYSNDTPTIRIFRQTLLNERACFQRKIRTLTQQNKRQEQRIARLNTIVKELKEKLADKKNRN